MGTPQEGAETAQERAADSGKGVIPPDPQEGVQGAQRAGEGQINAAPEGTAKWIVPFNQQEAKNLTSKKGIVAGHGISFRQFIDNAVAVMGDAQGIQERNQHVLVFAQQPDLKQMVTDFIAGFP